MNRHAPLAALCIVVLLAACGKAPEKASSTPAARQEAVAARSAAAFDAELDALTRLYFEELPEMATYLGAPAEIAPGADGKLNDRSIAADAARRQAMERELARLKAIDAAALNHRRRVIRDMLVAQLDGALGPARIVSYGAIFGVYGSWFTPYVVMQNSGPAVDVVNLMQAQQKVATPDEAETYLARLAAFGPMIDGVIAKMKHDATLGVIPPDFILAKTQNVIKAFITPPPAQNDLVASFKQKLTAADIAGADDYAAHAADFVRTGVYPAEERLYDYLGALKQTADHDAGLWRLPHGAELYQAMIREMTDTDMTADEIHNIGLKEVDRISTEMDVILKTQGYVEGSVGERMARFAEERRFFYPNTEEGKAQILAKVRDDLDRVSALLPEWFGLQPKVGVEVRAVPSFSQDSAPSGYYDSPSADGARPGVYWINLRDTAIWPKFALPTLTYHEAVPGHHLQNAIALGRKTPLILSALYSNAYGEGWALYAEALAKEMGLYADDPFGDLGRLRDELHRAVRLVVDTGIHAKKWSREEAIDYMTATEGRDRSDVESEIERYVVWPGQALGYKVGMLKILVLRERAAKALGPAFDIRKFHDAVLEEGPVPLPVLEENIDAWIDREKAAEPPATP